MVWAMGFPCEAERLSPHLPISPDRCKRMDCAILETHRFWKLADRQGIGVPGAGTDRPCRKSGAEADMPMARWARSRDAPTRRPVRVGAKLRTCSFDYMQAERCIFGW